MLEKSGSYKLKTKWKDVDNDFIYSTFNTDVVTKLYLQENEGYKELLSSIFVKNNISEIENDELDSYHQLSTLLDQNYFKNNAPSIYGVCTYEFDINEMDKFVDFIESKFGEKINIPKLATTKKVKNKLVVDDKLKQFIYSNFQIKLEKTKKTLL